ncbi:hypothetical protein CALVIDRAFT_565495 [Calocera viscosa TUFC12733]|uniref:ABM domain-containing protein n=1 Tax=Calocera viscosa (strain TUFC12733) TaxID=1330018 RepID=A0A167KL73_CALVF|nr:hypothetical protein CALVIDRAFT_565495 [Calocera viscosa TUFC12733]
MSTEEQLPYEYEVVLFKPNKADPAVTRGKTAAGFAIQTKHEDLVRYALEGVKVEDDSIALRILQWTSYDGHMRFRASPLYPQFTAAREGAGLELISLTHFHFYGPLSFETAVPVFEVIDINLKPAGVSSFPFFLSGVNEALSIVGAYSGLGYTLGWQKEDPSKVMVFIGWNSVEHHMQDFRNSGDKGWHKFVAKWAPTSAQYFDVKEMYHLKTVKIGESV